MKKQLTVLLVCVAVLVLLGAGLAFALGQRDANDTASAPQTLTVLAADPADLQSVTLTNPAGQVTLVRAGDELQVAGLDGVKAAAGQLDLLVSQCTSLSATQEVELPEDAQLVDFGLQPPAAEAQIVYADSTVTVAVGGDAPAGMGRYLRANDRLYLVAPDSVSAYTLGLLDFVSTVPVDFLTEEVTIRTVTLANAFTGELPIELTYHPAPLVSTSASAETAPPEAGYRMTAPYQEELAAADVDVWARNAVFGLTAQKAVALRPDDAALAGYGLDQPQAVITVETTDGETVRLLAGYGQDGGCYLMRDGDAVVYVVDPGNIPWMNLSVELARGSIFPPTETAEVAEVTIEASSERYTISADGVNGNASDPATIDTLIERVLRLPPKRPSAPIDPKLTPAATVTIRYADPVRVPATLSLVPTGSGELYLVLDGGCRFVTDERELTGLLAACKDAAI